MSVSEKVLISLNGLNVLLMILSIVTYGSLSFPVFALFLIISVLITIIHFDVCRNHK